MKLTCVLVGTLASLQLAHGHRDGIFEALEHIKEMADNADKKYGAQSKKILRTIKRQVEESRINV